MTEYCYRTIIQEDVDDLFELSNDPVIRKNSLCSGTITYDTHVKWFSAQLSTNAHMFYLIKTLKNELMGYVRFHQEDQYTDGVVITIHLAENFRGCGWESKLIKTFSTKILDEFLFQQVVAIIKKDNLASRRNFEKSDYQFSKSDVVNGSLVDILLLEKL